MEFMVKKILFITALSLLLINSCSSKNEPGGEVVIKFDGGTVTMDEINSRAGTHLEQLRKREDEIKYRTAVQILMNKIYKMENKDSGSQVKSDNDASRGKSDTGSGDPQASKNIPRKDDVGKDTKKPASIPDMEELQKVFIKYKVQNNLKRPE